MPNTRGAFMTRPAISGRTQSAGMLVPMAQWYSKALGDGMTADLPLREIEAEFAPRFEASGRPDDMAVFKHHELGDSLFCAVTAYFSPAAAAVAHACDAAPCEPPPADDMILVIGNKRCWDALFNSHRQ